MEDNQVFVALYINKMNTQIAISTDKENMKIVDMSYGYGKASSTSLVLFDDSDEEFLFFDNCLNSDIYENSYFESIIDILNSKDEYIEFKNKKYSKVDILTLFLTKCLEYIYEINHNFEIAKLCVCSEVILDEKGKTLFTDAFLENSVSIDKVKFVEPEEALYIDTIYNKKDEEDFTILFLDNFEAKELNLSRNIDDSFKEKRKTKDNLEISKIYNKIVADFIKIYEEKNSNSKIGFKEYREIDKLVYKNLDLILKRFIEKEDCKIFFNFCFPPFEATVAYENLKEFFDEKFIEKYVNKKIYLYTEGVSSNIFKNNLFKDCEIIESSLIFGILYKACHDVNVKIIKGIEFKSDFGFILNKDDKDIFYPIIQKDDSYLSKFKAHYFYYRKNEHQVINIYKKDYDNYKLVKELSLKDLNINTEFTRLKISTILSENNTLSIVIENEGFLNRNQNLVNSFDKVSFEINEVHQ